MIAGAVLLVGTRVLLVGLYYLLGWGFFYIIPIGAMENTILIGDRIFTWPHSESSRIDRGDIIVFRYPVDLEQTFVKRVVGVPGDRIRIDNKQLSINGREPEEPYATYKTSYVDSYRDGFPAPIPDFVYDGAKTMLREHVHNGEVLVPDDSYFVLGDNRDLSLDSRYWGFVPRENIIAKPLFIYWSHGPDDHGQLEWLATGAGTVRWSRIFTRIHPCPLADR